MRLTRNFIDAPLAVDTEFELPDAVGNHLVRVLRLSEGDALVLFNGDGADYDATLLSVSKRGARARVHGRRTLANESPLRLRLAQAVARGEKMDWILQKATELGACAIDPVVTERTEVKLDSERGEKRRAHWRGVMAAASEQSGRAVVPALGEVQSLANYAAQPLPPCRLMLDPDAAHGLQAIEFAGAREVVLLVGPEGGLSPRDIALLKAAGFQGVRIGPRVLRTETAGLAVIAALQALYGDWRQG